MAAALLASPLAIDAIYTPKGRGSFAVRALPGERDQEASSDGVRSRIDVMQLRIRRADLDEPGRGDQFEVDGITYEVASPPEQDLRKLWWLIAGYEVRSA